MNVFTDLDKVFRTHYRLMCAYIYLFYFSYFFFVFFFSVLPVLSSLNTDYSANKSKFIDGVSTYAELHIYICPDTREAQANAKKESFTSQEP